VAEGDAVNYIGIEDDLKAIANARVSPDSHALYDLYLIGKALVFSDYVFSLPSHPNAQAWIEDHDEFEKTAAHIGYSAKRFSDGPLPERLVVTRKSKESGHVVTTFIFNGKAPKP
jgi:hypothetical protein